MISAIKVANPLHITYCSKSTRIWHVWYQYRRFLRCWIHCAHFYIGICWSSSNSGKWKGYLSKKLQFYSKWPNVFSCHLTPGVKKSPKMFPKHASSTNRLYFIYMSLHNCTISILVTTVYKVLIFALTPQIRWNIRVKGKYDSWWAKFWLVNWLRCL